jgi:hypothetical protein
VSMSWMTVSSQDEIMKFVSCVRWVTDQVFQLERSQCEFLCQECTGLYVFLMIGFQQIRCVNVISQFSCVITFRVSSPFDEIL